MKLVKFAIKGVDLASPLLCRLDNWFHDRAVRKLIPLLQTDYGASPWNAMQIMYTMYRQGMSFYHKDYAINQIAGKKFDNPLQHAPRLTEEERPKGCGGGSESS